MNPDHLVSEDDGIQSSFRPGPNCRRATMSINAASGDQIGYDPPCLACSLPRRSGSIFFARSSAYGSGSNCVSTLGNCPPGPGNSISLSNSTRMGVLIPTLHWRCVSSGKMGAVAPPLEATTGFRVAWFYDRLLGQGVFISLSLKQ